MYFDIDIVSYTLSCWLVILSTTRSVIHVSAKNIYLPGINLYLCRDCCRCSSFFVDSAFQCRMLQPWRMGLLRQLGFLCSSLDSEPVRTKEYKMGGGGEFKSPVALL